MKKEFPPLNANEAISYGYKEWRWLFQTSVEENDESLQQVQCAAEAARVNLSLTSTVYELGDPGKNAASLCASFLSW